jgi:fumarate reductase flavoprotein subunit
MKKFVARKLLPLLFALVLTLSLVGCQASTSAFKAGTYQATVQGHNGELTVEVVVDDSTIKSVVILEHQESVGIADGAIERIPVAVVETQSIAVDTVSGATVTSKAIIAAVTEALKKAGGDIAKLSIKNTEAVKKGQTEEYTADVIVIGGGGAGLAAAVAAHQKGATVIVLEKMSRLGGNTILSGGAFNAVDPVRQQAQGIEDSTDKHYQQTFDGGDQQGNPVLVRTLVDNAYGAIQWLEELGMKFNDTVFTVLGGMWPRAHKPSTPLGTGFISTYTDYIEKNDGITVLLDTEALELIIKDGRVSGVKAEDLNSDVILHANNGVVLATGGFSANQAMLEKYNEVWPSLANAKTTNHPGATGDGLVMAEAIGASLIGLSNIQLLPMGDPVTGSLSGNIEQGVENRIFVNKEGNRFVDEGARRDVMTKALMAQTDSWLWVVLDAKNYPTKETKNNFNETIEDLIAQGRAFKGNTLEELAAQIGVDPANLVKSVAEFNAAVDSGKPDAFGRTLFDTKIDTPPYYAGARIPTVHHTMGGVEINEYTQVLDVNGAIIPSLYAAGEVTGGIHGSNRLGGNALADITVFGRIAGESAAMKR